MIDPYARAIGLPRRVVVITPHDTNPLPTPAPDFIYVGTTGDVKMRPEGNDVDVTFKGALGGLTLMAKPTHIRATGTTAGAFLGLYYS